MTQKEQLEARLTPCDGCGAWETLLLDGNGCDLACRRGCKGAPAIGERERAELALYLKTGDADCLLIGSREAPTLLCLSLYRRTGLLLGVRCASWADRLMHSASPSAIARTASLRQSSAAKDVLLERACVPLAELSRGELPLASEIGMLASLFGREVRTDLRAWDELSANELVRDRVTATVLASLALLRRVGAREALTVTARRERDGAFVTLGFSLPTASESLFEFAPLLKYAGERGEILQIVPDEEDPCRVLVNAGVHPVALSRQGVKEKDACDDLTFLESGSINATCGELLL